MDRELNEVEIRVLGALMEKDAATPDHYPLTLNSLCAATNQKSNREPVMSLDEDDVAGAIDSLRALGLASEISGAGHRVRKYGHRTGEVFNFDRREQAILCVLMLRGPQTVGELRGRTERMHHFDDLEAVVSTLRRLSERAPALVVQLPRRPGEKEPRFAHLLAGEVEISAMEPPATPAARPSPLQERVTSLEEQLSQLRHEFEEFRAKFE